MAKLRLDLLKYREIIMKDIISVIIDDIKYIKNDYITEDTRTIQNFYYFVKKNKEKITFLCFKNHGSDDFLEYIYMKDGKLHNICDYAIYSLYVSANHKHGNYYINGERLEFTEWQRKVRKTKLQNLITE